MECVGARGDYGGLYISKGVVEVDGTQYLKSGWGLESHADFLKTVEGD